jgi:ribonuclease HII
MKNVIHTSSHFADYVIVDGNFVPDGLTIPAEAIVNGDNVSVSIAAASIVAKVFRDESMLQLHKLYPMYGFNKNKGYGTKEHMEAIKKYGITPHHRKSFSGVKEYEKS